MTQLIMYDSSAGSKPVQCMNLMNNLVSSCLVVSSPVALRRRK